MSSGAWPPRRRHTPATVTSFDARAGWMRNRATPVTEERIQRWSVLGGLINEYERAA